VEAVGVEAAYRPFAHRRHDRQLSSADEGR
jgi:hypothetical protein